MKHTLFSGNRKLVTIPAIGLIGLFFLPITIGLLLMWLVHTKVGNKKIKYTLNSILGMLTLLFGISYTMAMTSPPSTKTQTEVQSAQAQIAQPTIAPTLYHSPTPQVSPTIVNPNRTSAIVVTIVDGDTFDVSLDGTTQRVRYIGIDTPESVDPRQGVQCFGSEATNKNKEILQGQTVELEKDVSDKDRYGRLLRYVYIGNRFINQELVAQGYAKAVSYPPDIKYQETFRQAEQQARNTNAGLWSACKAATPAPTKKPAVYPTTNPQSNTTSTSSGSCKYSCSGPDKDCSDFSSHAEAQAFFNCCGFTAEIDPMRLDSVGVGDGIACEGS